MIDFKNLVMFIVSAGIIIAYGAVAIKALKEIFKSNK